MSYSKAVRTGNVTLNGKLDVTGEVTGKTGSGGSVTLTGYKGHTSSGGPPTSGT